MGNDPDRIVHRVDDDTSTSSTANLWVIGLVALLWVVASILDVSGGMP